MVAYHQLCRPCFPKHRHFLPFTKPQSYTTRYFSVSCGALPNKKKLVFLGTPHVAAYVLDRLLTASQAETSNFEISAVVTQPPATKGRGKKLSPSPVAELAINRHFPTSNILWPERAGEDVFLSTLREIQPDLCITAAYGNILPKRFLEIPAYGTVNIHPSLLPLYRGAAPVQRAIQDDVHVTGVTVAFTVRAMDAGPIISSESVEIDDYIKAPELLQLLFEKGVDLLIRELPSILDGSAAGKAREQDHDKATHAPKVTVDEAWLDFTKPARILHNKVRAFADWPGAKARLEVLKPGAGSGQIFDLKIITTRAHTGIVREDDKYTVKQEGSSLVVFCEDNSALEILELQPPGKRIMSAKDFLNGLRGQELRVVDLNRC